MMTKVYVKSVGAFYADKMGKSPDRVARACAWFVKKLVGGYVRVVDERDSQEATLATLSRDLVKAVNERDALACEASERLADSEALRAQLREATGAATELRAHMADLKAELDHVRKARAAAVGQRNSAYDSLARVRAALQVDVCQTVDISDDPDTMCDEEQAAVDDAKAEVSQRVREALRTGDGAIAANGGDGLGVWTLDPWDATAMVRAL